MITNVIYDDILNHQDSYEMGILANSTIKIPSGNQTWQCEIPCKWRFEWENHRTYCVIVHCYV